MTELVIYLTDKHLGVAKLGPEMEPKADPMRVITAIKSTYNFRRATLDIEIGSSADHFATFTWNGPANPMFTE